jgi:Fe-S-cluster-containing hydrogenase component 2
MYPAFTTRRGIYYLNPALVMPDKEQSVRQAMPSIIEDMVAIAKDDYPREIIRGWQFPEVDPNKCAFCYSCFRACSHGALEPDLEASSMKVVEPLCQACGTCMAICPGEAIKRKDSAEAPDFAKAAGRQTGKGRCKIYCCENGAAQAFESALPSLGGLGQGIACERVACGGSVSTDKLANDFRDYETVIVACCIEDACRHIDGDRRACKQSLRAAELLRKAGLGSRRLEVINVSHAMSDVMKDNILSVLEGQA